MSTRNFESLDEGRITFEETGKMDPVCGALVDPNKPTTANAEFAGVAYFFCSNECKQQFLATPNAFAVTKS
jgi:YHS domain-containing protein